MKLRFEWDQAKNEQNIRKHGVSFEEAATVFSGFPLEVFFDPDHSAQEDRYIAFGYSERNRVLMVVHCENAVGTVIRIVSARKATHQERKAFLGGVL